MSISEHRHCCVMICMGKKPIVSVTYQNERISIKNSLPYLQCVLRLCCVVHGAIYGLFMGCYISGFLSIKRFIQYREKTVYIKTQKNSILFATLNLNVRNTNCLILFHYYINYISGQVSYWYAN